LTGLPVIINRRPGTPVPELTDDICVKVDNAARSYRDALETLIRDNRRRENLGRTAGAHARANWSPQVTERVFVDVYRQVIGRRQAAGQIM
jgi:glycosyltransferase involved in cell wall biosynthesis